MFCLTGKSGRKRKFSWTKNLLPSARRQSVELQTTAPASKMCETLLNFFRASYLLLEDNFVAGGLRGCLHVPVLAFPSVLNFQFLRVSGDNVKSSLGIHYASYLPLWNSDSLTFTLSSRCLFLFFGWMKKVHIVSGFVPIQSVGGLWET